MVLVWFACVPPWSNPTSPATGGATDTAAETGTSAHTGVETEPTTDPYPGYTDPFGRFPDGTTVLTGTTTGTSCVADTGAGEAILTAEAGPADVRFRYHGPVEGCGGAQPVALFGLGSSGTGTLVFIDGDCDLIVCDDLDVSVSGFPSGTWRIAEARTGVVADVIVP